MYALATHSLYQPFFHQPFPLAKPSSLGHDRMVVSASNAYSTSLPIASGRRFAAQRSRLATLPYGVAFTYLLPGEAVAIDDQLPGSAGVHVANVLICEKVCNADCADYNPCFGILTLICKSDNTATIVSTNSVFIHKQFQYFSTSFAEPFLCCVAREVSLVHQPCVVPGFAHGYALLGM